MTRFIARIHALFACVFVLHLTGCAAERVSGDTATYTYSWGVAILAAVGSAALAILGIRVVREEGQFGKKFVGFVMVACGLLFLLGFTPRVFFTYVTVDANHVEGDNRALWFLPDPKKQFNIPLRDVVSLEERTKTERGGRRKKSVKYLVFRRSTGGETELLYTSLLSAARPRIEDALKANTSASVVAESARQSPGPSIQAALEASATQVSSSVAALTSPETPSAPPAVSAATDAPNELPEQSIGPETTLKVGMPLQANWGNKWWPAQVVQLMPDGQVKIHYDGWSNSNDEVLPRTRLRLANGGTLNMNQRSNSSRTPRSESNVTAATVVRKGQRLETRWGSKWWDSRVIDVLPDGSVIVHYEGWSDNFDETVPRDRLRLIEANK